MEKSKGQMKSRLSYAAGAFGNDVFYATRCQHTLSCL